MCQEIIKTQRMLMKKLKTNVDKQKFCFFLKSKISKRWRTQVLEKNRFESKYMFHRGYNQQKSKSMSFWRGQTEHTNIEKQPECAKWETQKESTALEKHFGKEK